MSRSASAPGKLNERQHTFVQEYLVDLNGTQAAIRAGYAARTARITAAQLLAKPNIKALVDAGMESRNARTNITQDKVLTELSTLAHSNVDDYAIDPTTGRLVPAEGRSPDVMRAVSSVKYKTRTFVREGGDDDEDTIETVHEVEFRLWDKPNTLKLEGRHVGLFPNNVQVDLGEKTLSGILAMAHEARAERKKQQAPLPRADSTRKRK